MGCVKFSIAARRTSRFYGRMAGHAPHPSPHRFRRASPQPSRGKAPRTPFAHLGGGEGECLRSRAGERRPILLLQGFFSPAELEPIAAHRLTTVVHDPGQLAALERARLPKKIAVYAKLNTGMNRLGFAAEDLRG